MQHLSEYVNDLAARGQYHFTTTEAVTALGRSVPTVRASLRRLKARRQIADPHRGFHVVVPSEFRGLGCLPAPLFVPQLMAHLGEPYYVALDSAARLHCGVSTTAAFEVMLAMNRRSIHCGTVQVVFSARKDLNQTAVVEHKTALGAMRVASREDTALELVGYAPRCGGYDTVVAILRELAKRVEAEKLRAAIERSPIKWAQRLGHLLDLAGHRTLANTIQPLVVERAQVVTPLMGSAERCGPRIDRWKLEWNVNVDPKLVTLHEFWR